MNIEEQASKGVTTALTGWWENIKANFSPNATVEALRSEHAAEVKRLTDKIAGHETTISAHAGEITKLKADHAVAILAKDVEIETAKNAAQTALAKAGHTAVPAEAPKGTQNMTLEQALEAMNKETDSAKRYALAMKVRELRGKN